MGVAIRLASKTTGCYFPATHLVSESLLNLGLSKHGSFHRASRRDIVCRAVKGLVAKYGLDLVIANAENAAGGSGLTPSIYRELIRAGAKT